VGNLTRKLRRKAPKPQPRKMTLGEMVDRYNAADEAERVRLADGIRSRRDYTADGTPDAKKLDWLIEKLGLSAAAVQNG
jgi:hypothetical protein